MIHQMSIFFQKNSLFLPDINLRPLFCFKDPNNRGFLIIKSLKQKKIILTDSETKN